MNVLITGASSGIGKELARRLVVNGHIVWGIARRKELLERLKNELHSNLFLWSVCDTSNPNSVDESVRMMRERQFIPDAVVLNAAIVKDDTDPTTFYQNAVEVMRTNLEGPLLWVNSFLELFRKRNHGQFIAISSLFAHWPDATSASYAASKAGLAMAIRSLQIRYAKEGIQFKTINLGPVSTAINPRFAYTKSSLFVSSPEKAAQFIAKTINSNHSDFYFPWYVWLIRCTLWWLPDTWFEALSKPFRR